MENEQGSAADASGWRARQVYVMAAICLMVGTALGYFFRGSGATPASHNTAMAAPVPSQPASANTHAQPQPMPTLEQMKKMADAKAGPLLEKLKADPNNVTVLNQVGTVYESTHQFKEAQQYFEKALKIEPRNVPIRTEMASCMYYNGDVDGALSQLDQSLKYSPKDINSLYNLGMIKWKGKNDPAGALAAWKKLLKENPAFEKRSAVEHSLALLKQQASIK